MEGFPCTKYNSFSQWTHSPSQSRNSHLWSSCWNDIGQRKGEVGAYSSWNKGKSLVEGHDNKRGGQIKNTNEETKTNQTNEWPRPHEMQELNKWIYFMF